MKYYSELVTEIRERLRLDRREFSDKLEVSYHTVYSWELGRKFPSRKNMQKLIKYANRHGLKIDSTYFLDV